MYIQQLQTVHDWIQSPFQQISNKLQHWDIRKLNSTVSNNNAIKTWDHLYNAMNIYLNI
jgi:hypothetical protein